MTLARSRPDPTKGAPQSRSASVRSIDREKRTIEVVASTETRDSHGTILLQDWDLSRYERNPVVLWAHNMGDDVDLPIGRATARVEGNELIATIEFVPAAINEFAESVFQHYAAGFLKAVSVGFDFNSYRWEERDGVEVLVLFGLELFEISCVPVGSNPDALARAIKKTGSTPGTEKTPMTDEEKVLLALARAAMTMLGATDPTAAEASLRGLIDGQKVAAENLKTLEATRTALATERRRVQLDEAVRSGLLPPRAEWGEELTAYLESLSPLAAEGSRSPLESYLRTLSPRAPVGRVEPKAPPIGADGETPPKGGARASDSYAVRNGVDPKYVEQAREQKAALSRGKAVTQ
jgi:HK97 family phage prohead protease